MINRTITAFSLCGVVMLFGCQKTEVVQSFRIEKSKSGLDILNDSLAQTAPPQSLTPTHRMVVAISLRDDATWFYKITGAIEAVGQAEFKWTDFLKSVRMGESGDPEWDVPDGWTVGEKRPMRFATLTAGTSESPVEIAISSLSANQDVLLNVNRWRRQLGLAPLTQAQLALGEIESTSGKLLLFDERGRLGAGGRPPMMGQLPPTDTSSTVPEMKFELPDGWTAGKTSSIVKVRLHKKSDAGGEAQIRVVDMPAAVNTWIPNAQRWAGQVGLSDNEDFLMKRTTKVTVDGIEGQRLNLIGGDDDQATQAAVGAMIVRGSSAWFFLLIGEKALVAENESVFDEFLKSFKF